MKKHFLAIALGLVSLYSLAQDIGHDLATKELRYCGTPARTASGVIIRRADTINSFRKAHACPSTGLTTGACAGWAIDHVVPLACGGCDAVSNMQWLPDSIKSAAGTSSKDRWERSVYPNLQSYNGPACQSKVVTK